MKRLKVGSLKAGMKFDKPVYIEGNNIFVPPEIPVKEKDIKRLVNWEIDEVFTEGSVIINDESQSILNTPLPQKSADTLPFYDAALEELREVFLNIKNDSFTSKDVTLIDTIAEEVYLHMKEYDHLLIQNIVIYPSESDSFVSGALNTAILSGVIGQTFINVKSKLMLLIKSALLHDTGMMKVQNTIIQKKGKLSVSELSHVREHVKHSYSIAKKMEFSEDIAQFVLNHHEKWNGQGYPGGLKGREIPLESRIIAVADAYIALLNKRAYRNSLIGYNAMKALLSDNSTHFDPSILKIFLKKIGIYPIGSYVQMNDHSIARVIQTNEKSPLLPKIKIVKDTEGNPFDSDKEVNLVEQNDLYILKAIDPVVETA